MGAIVKLPDILSEGSIDPAATLVSAYYRLTTKNLPAYTGSLFNAWTGGGDAPGVANRITSDDLVAVSFLSVDVPGEAAIGILDTHAGKVSALLEQIPANLDLAKVTAEDFESLLGDNSPAHELWHVLRARDTGRWGVGETTASKLMARKRPNMIPIYDSVVGPVMGLKDSRGQWKSWHAALTDGSGLPQRLEEIRNRSCITDPISDLRVMDIVLWMHGKQELQAAKN